MDINVRQKLDKHFKQYKNQKYKKGEILVRADDDPAGVFYLVDGVVRRYSISPAGEELNLNIYRPVSFFPMDWAVNQTSSPHYYEAMTTAEVYRAPRDEVLKFISDKPDILLDLLSRIYHGLDGFMMRMEYLMAGNAQAKVVIKAFFFFQRSVF